MKTLVKHIALVLTWSTVLCAGALQYTHDVSHGGAADGCSLCWFVQHQVASDVGPVPNFIEPHIRPVSVCQNAEYTAFVPLRFVLREGNKDPPGPFAQQNPKTQFVTAILSAI